MTNESQAITKRDPRVPDVARLQARASALGVDVLLTPIRVDEDGTGIYTDLSADLYKQLKVEGALVAYGHDGDQRRFQVQKSATAAATFLGLAILSGASYDLVKHTVLAVLHRHAAQGPVKVSFAVERPSGSRMMHFEGLPKDVRAAIEAADPDSKGTPTA